VLQDYNPFPSFKVLLTGGVSANINYLFIMLRLFVCPHLGLLMLHIENGCPEGTPVYACIARTIDWQCQLMLIDQLIDRVVLVWLCLLGNVHAVS
jgi:hypothetical protein